MGESRKMEIENPGLFARIMEETPGIQNQKTGKMGQGLTR